VKSSPPNSSSPAADRVLVSIFLLMIALPSIANLLRLESRVPQLENRRLTAFPALSLDATKLAAFPSAFEAYYNDHFGLRNQFIRWHNILKLRALHVSPSRHVILGKENWLFDDDTVAYYCAPTLTTAELEKWERAFEERARFVAAEGAAYVLVFVPTSTSIYPEFLPDWVKRQNHETRLDQLLRQLRAHSQISIVDLRDSLLKAKSGARLYHRTDSHWNDHGAHVGYGEIMRTVARQFPGTDPLPPSAFEPRVVTTPGGDIARMLALPDVLTEEALELLPRTPRRSRIAEWLPEGTAPPPTAFRMKLDDYSKPRAIIFHDSFTYASLYPFLAEHFGDVWFHWNHYFGPGLQVSIRRGQPLWNPQRMAAPDGEWRPDVVIQIFAERFLLYKPLSLWAETDEGSG
jgi:alginate O-acetyltransferase complex protein AlgJ